MKVVLTLLIVVAVGVAALPAWAQYQPYYPPNPNPSNPYYVPHGSILPGPQTRQRSGQDFANEVLRGVLPSYQQQMLEEQRRQNSGHNSWMNRCHAMGGNPAAQALCYQGGR